MISFFRRLSLVRLASFGTAFLLCVAARAQGMAAGDFNHDGYTDLAIGVPDEGIRVKGVNKANAGAAHVLYGTSSGGLSATGSEFLYQGAPDVADAAETNDRFGYSLAAGDFNGDKYDDLAVGVPGQSIGGKAGAGAVHLFYGSANGFIFVSLGTTRVNDVVWHSDSPGALGTAQAHDSFGWSLATGDFNDDKFKDLAVGVPYDDPVVTNSGSVHVFYGSTAGIVADDIAATPRVNEDDRIWHQDSGTIINDCEADDHFGWALASGDFNKDGYDDLAIGVPGESIGIVRDPAADAGPKNAGAVTVMKGSAAGLTDTGNKPWYETSPSLTGLLDTAEEGDNFGYSLAAGDFDGNGYDDLCIGVPGETDESNPLVIKLNIGAVHVIYGSDNGLQYQGQQYWRQSSSTAEGTIADIPESEDQFGFSLAASDLNGDGFDDLVIGVPSEDVAVKGNRVDAGAANVLYGRTGDGITVLGNQFWHQDSINVRDEAESRDRFGTSLVIGDFNGDKRGDLAIGVPGESLSSGAVLHEHAGAVNVLHGRSAGLAAADDAATANVNEDDQFWHQDSPNIAEAIEGHDHFGGGRISP